MVRKRNAQGHWKREARVAVILAIAGLLSACSVSPAMCDAFGPSKRASVSLPQDASVENVFTCIDQQVAGNADRNSRFETGYAVRDVKTGVLESTNYSAQNVSGFRLRAEVSKPSSRLDLSLRGAGAYCTDLGVDREMAQLTADVSACLRR